MRGGVEVGVSSSGDCWLMEEVNGLLMICVLTNVLSLLYRKIYENNRYVYVYVYDDDGWLKEQKRR